MIRAFILDETNLKCDATAELIESESDFEIAGMAVSLENSGRAETADVILVAPKLESETQLDAIRLLASRFPDVLIIATGVPDSETEILRVIEAGAAGYILENDEAEALSRTIRAAYQKEAIVEPGIAAALIARLAELSDLCSKAGINPDVPPTLTAREKEVLTRLGDGQTNQEIAEGLAIEVGTVKNHVHSILKKLQVRTRQEAAALYAGTVAFEEPTETGT